MSLLRVKPFPVITSEDIANAYFEPLSTVRIEGTDADILDEGTGRSLLVTLPVIYLFISGFHLCSTTNGRPESTGAYLLSGLINEYWRLRSLRGGALRKKHCFHVAVP